MHQNAFGGRAPPGPAGGTNSAPPDPLAVFGGRGAPPRKRKGNGEGKGKVKGEWKGKGKGEEGSVRGKGGGEGKEEGGKGLCSSNFYRCPPHFLIPGVAPDCIGLELSTWTWKLPALPRGSVMVA